MNEKDLKYYKVIGKLHSAISSAKSFEEAVKEGLKAILRTGIADYAVIRYVNTKEKTLCPYYWICPGDLTAQYCHLGKGSVGKAYEENSPILCEDPENEPGGEFYRSLGVCSLFCVPFACKNTDLGCIEYLKKEESGTFSSEDRDVCVLLSMIAQMTIEEEAPLPETPEKRELLLSVRDVYKTYKNGEEYTTVLKGVSFDLFKGEFLCFLGESGCGKSTMLNILGGLLSADSGSISYGERELIGASDAALTDYRRKKTGFVFQSYNLMPNLTARQNLDLIASLVKDPLPSKEALDLVGLGDKANNYPSTLSGGQQQRISIARALVKRPEILFADEPTAALDYKTSIEVLSVFDRVVKSGTTLVMVTHNEEITKMADRVIRFKDGRTYEITVNTHKLKAEELEW